MPQEQGSAPIAAVPPDAVHSGQDALRADLARCLGEPLTWPVQQADFVRDLMVVDIRFRAPELSRGTERRTRTAPAADA